jgi:hypothetical protein
MSLFLALEFSITATTAGISIEVFGHERAFLTARAGSLISCHFS